MNRRHPPQEVFISHVHTCTALSLWYTNADTLHNKKDELQTRINAEEDLDVLIITETWPKNRGTMDVAALQFEGFNLFHNTSNSGRGVAIYARTYLMVTEVSLNCIFEEQMVIKVKLRNNEHLFIGAIYRSPNSSPENNQMLLDLLHCISETARGNPLVVAGDFNYPGINWITKETSGGNNATQFIDTTEDLFWTQHVDFETRAREGQTPSTLD